MDLNDFGTQEEKYDHLDRITIGIDEAEENIKKYTEKNQEDAEKFFSQYPIRWTSVGGENYISGPSTIKNLPSNLYSAIYDNRRDCVIFEKKTINIDDLIVFSSSIVNRILSEISNFWKKQDVFYNYGFLHKRGYLFYGPTGSGKSCIVQQIIKDILKNNGIAVSSSNPATLCAALTKFRKIEPNRNLVCILEDIDSTIEQYGDKDILALLDGEVQIDRILTIATTNYPEKLDKRIVARPRRFDKVYKIEMPSEDNRREYLIHKLKFQPGKELEEWVKETENFSFASLSELVISVKCLENTFKSTIETLKTMSINSISSKDFENKPGFNK